MNPDSIRRIEATAQSNAGDALAGMPFSVLDNALAAKAVHNAIRDAFMKGADAGYTAAKAEERR